MEKLERGKKCKQDFFPQLHAKNPRDLFIYQPTVKYT